VTQLGGHIVNFWFFNKTLDPAQARH
jgi:hypothetical protein